MKYILKVGLLCLSFNLIAPSFASAEGYKVAFNVAREVYDRISNYNFETETAKSLSEITAGIAEISELTRDIPDTVAEIVSNQSSKEYLTKMMSLSRQFRAEFQDGMADCGIDGSNLNQLIGRYNDLAYEITSAQVSLFHSYVVIFSDEFRGYLEEHCTSGFDSEVMRDVHRFYYDRAVSEESPINVRIDAVEDEQRKRVAEINAKLYGHIKSEKEQSELENIFYEHYKELNGWGATGTEGVVARIVWSCAARRNRPMFNISGTFSLREGREYNFYYIEIEVSFERNGDVLDRVSRVRSREKLLVVGDIDESTKHFYDENGKFKCIGLQAQLSDYKQPSDQLERSFRTATKYAPVLDEIFNRTGLELYNLRKSLSEMKERM